MTKLNSTPFLLDSSIIVKWFADEPDSEKARYIGALFASGNISIAITELSFYEVTNALRYKNNYDHDLVNRSIYELAASDVYVIPFDLNALQIAVEIAYEADISIYDAYFAAISDLEGLRFVTADRRLFRKLRGLTDIVMLEEAV